MILWGSLHRTSSHSLHERVGWAPPTELPTFIDYLRHGCKVPTLFSPCEPRVPCESQPSQGYFVIDEQYDVSNHIVRLFLYDIEMPLGLLGHRQLIAAATSCQWHPSKDGLRKNLDL